MSATLSPALDYASANVPSQTPAPASTRLVSLDAYRGLVMLLMASEGLGFAKFVTTTRPRRPNLAPARRANLPRRLARAATSGISSNHPSPSSSRRDALLDRPPSRTRPAVRPPALPRDPPLLHPHRARVLLRSIGQHQTYYTFEDTLSQIGLGYTFAFLLAWIRPRWQVTAVAAAIVLILVGYWLAFALYPLPAANFDYSTSTSPPRSAPSTRCMASPPTGQEHQRRRRLRRLVPQPLPRASRSKATAAATSRSASSHPRHHALGPPRRKPSAHCAHVPREQDFILITAGLVGLGLGTLLDLTASAPT